MPGIWFDLEGLKVYFPYDYVYKEQVRVVFTSARICGDTPLPTHVLVIFFAYLSSLLSVFIF